MVELASDGFSFVMADVTSGNGCADYGDLATALQAMIDGCQKNGQVAGRIEVANARGLSLRTHTTEPSRGDRK